MVTATNKTIISFFILAVVYFLRGVPAEVVEWIGEGEKGGCEMRDVYGDGWVAGLARGFSQKVENI